MNPTQKPTLTTKLERTITLGNGRTARRCQARAKRSGTQCKRPASAGYNVCHVHGAGTHKRLKEGTRKLPGRPVTHGLYSDRTRTLPELTGEILTLEHDLNDTDRDMAANKAIAISLLHLVPNVEQLAERVQLALEQDPALSLEEKVNILRDVLRAEGMMLRLHGVHARNILSGKHRAETMVKLGETRVLEVIGQIVPVMKGILMDMLDEDRYEAFFERFRREVLGPNGIKVPDKELN